MRAAGSRSLRLLVGSSFGETPKLDRDVLNISVPSHILERFIVVYYALPGCGVAQSALRQAYSATMGVHHGDNLAHLVNFLRLNIFLEVQR